MSTSGSVVAETVRKLRTSMNTIHGMSLLAREHARNTDNPQAALADTTACLDVLLPETARMLSLIDDLTNMSDSAKAEDSSHDSVFGHGVLFAGRRFLVVDDVDGNAEVASRMLQLAGGETLVAHDGAEAVKAFSDAPVGGIDAILMDLRMPGMDGYRATASIRELDRADAKKVPILAMSADAFDEDIRRAGESGMNGYLTKPFRFKELCDVLKKALA